VGGVATRIALTTLPSFSARWGSSGPKTLVSAGVDGVGSVWAALGTAATSTDVNARMGESLLRRDTKTHSD
jgi:hypothetical protein